MSGDYSRMRYTPRSGYIGTLEQQGRVRLDADGNELVESIDRRRRAEAIDTIGHGVVPLTTQDGFKITSPAAGQFMIGAGRAYVDGILVDCWGKDATATYQADLGELRSSDPLDYKSQPYYYGGSFPFPAGTSIVYLDVWEREVTALEDPGLIDPALEGIDTTTRLQAAWQVKALNNLGATTNCTDKTDWDNFLKGQLSTGVLTSGYVQVPSNASACVIDPSGGYTGLENRLYRVQIQKSGTVDGAGAATFVWSKDNAALGANILGITAITPAVQYKLSLSTVGKEKTFQFNINDVVEILDDYTEWSIRESKAGGTFVTVAAVDPEQLTITVNGDLSGFVFSAVQHPRIRKWEAMPQVTNSGTAIPLGAEGVTVTFGPTAADTLHAGDFWVFYARTATGKIEILTNAPPRGVLHHYMKLAVIAPGSAPQNCIVYWPPSFGGESCCTAVVNVGDDIQKAIDSLSQEGGCVCLKAGLHAISRPIVFERRSNIMFHGESIGAVVRNTGGGMALQIAVGSSNITVEHINFQVTPQETGKDAIVVMNSCSAVAIRDCQFAPVAVNQSPFDSFGIMIQLGTSVEIRGNVIQGCLGGIFAAEVNIEPDPADYLVISGNALSGVTAPDPVTTISGGATGIDVQGVGGNLIIENNDIVDFSQGIVVQGAFLQGTNPSQVSIKGNAVRRQALLPGTAPNFGWTDPLGKLVQAKVYGIVTDAAGAFVAGNTIQLADPGHGGILIFGSDCIVRENSVSSSVVVPQPPTAPAQMSSPAAASGGKLAGTYSFEVTYITATLESNPGPISNPFFVDAQNINVLQLPISTDTNVTGRRIYGFKYGNSSAFQLLATINDNTTKQFTVSTDQPTWGAGPPSPNYDWPSLPVGIIVFQPQTPTRTDRCRILGNTLSGPLKGIAVLGSNLAETSENRVTNEAYPEALNLIQAETTLSDLGVSLFSLNRAFGILLMESLLATVAQNIVMNCTVGIAALPGRSSTFELLRSSETLSSITVLGNFGEKFDGNYVAACTVGILLDHVSQAMVQNGEMLANQISIGLIFGSAAIVGNHLMGGFGVAHCLALQSATRFEANTVSGGQMGILAAFGSGVSFERNQIGSTQGTAILATSCSGVTHIEGNKLSGCGYLGGSPLEANSTFGGIVSGTGASLNFGTKVAASIAALNCSGLVTIDECDIVPPALLPDVRCIDIGVLNTAHTRVRDCRIIHQAPSTGSCRGLLILPAIDKEDVSFLSADVRGNHIDVTSPLPGVGFVDLMAVDVEVTVNAQPQTPCDVLFHGNLILQRGTRYSQPSLVRLFADTVAVTGNRIRSVMPSLQISASQAVSYVGNTLSQAAAVQILLGGTELPAPDTSFNVTA